MNEELDTARTLLTEQKYDQALVLSIKYINSSDEEEKFEALNITGIIYMEQKRSDLALDIFNQMLLIDKSCADAHYKKAAALDDLNKFDESLDEYESTIKLLYMIPECYFYMGIIYQKQKQYDKAFESYDQAIKNKENRSEQDQDTPPFDGVEDIYLNQISMSMIISKYEDAKFVAQKIIAIKPENDKAHYLLGKAEQSLGKYDSAIDEYKTCLKYNPSNTLAVMSIGQALKESHRYDEALEVYQNFIKIHPDDVEVVNEQGGVLFQQQKYEQALQCFEIVLQKQKNIKALNNKGLALKHLKRNDEAVTCFKQVIDADPKEVDALINLGSLLDDLHNYDEALEVYDRAILLEPNKADVHNNKGITLRNKKDLKASLECFEKATQLDEHYILGFANKAQVQQQLGLGPQALISLKKASGLLKDPVANKSLNDAHVKYIQSSVDKILDLQSKFHEQAEELEKALKQDLGIHMPVEQKVVLEEYKELKKQKDEIANLEFKKIQSAKNTTVNQVIEKESSTTDNSQVMILQKLQELTDQMMKLQKENINLQKQVSDNKDRVEIVSSKQEEIQDTLQITGQYDIVKIKQGWQKYKDLQSQYYYDYIKAFYWTLLNYFEAYRVANTGALQTNVGHTEDKNVSKGVDIATKVLTYGAKLAENLPFIGGAIGLINQAISAVYGKIKSNRFDNRINAINNIITNNADPDAQNTEDLSRSIALAALEIADRKSQIESNKKIKISFEPIEKEQGDFTKAINWIKKQVDNILQNDRTEVYATEGAKEALKDTMLLLIYLTSFDEKVIEETHNHKKFYVIIADAVIQKKATEIISEVSLDDDEKVTQSDIKLQSNQQLETTQKLDTNFQQSAKVVPEDYKQDEKKKSTSCCQLM